MPRSQLIEDVLLKKKLVTREELREARRGVMKQVIPRYIFTKEELKIIKTTLANMKIPRPTQWAQALYLHSMEQDRERYSPGYALCSCCWGNLRSTLHFAGLRGKGGKEIFKKIKKAQSSAEEYGDEELCGSTI